MSSPKSPFSEQTRGKMERGSRNLVKGQNRKRKEGDYLGVTSQIIPWWPPGVAIIADLKPNIQRTPGDGREIVLGRDICPPSKLGLFRI